MEDLCGHIGVRAVAVQQLAGDGHAGLAQLGDAGVEQRSCVCWALQVSGVLGRRARPS
jgi:hypothetical protein